MRTHWMSRLLALLSLACVMPASAQTYALLIDGDRSTSTGCTVTSDAGSVAGIDWRLTATVAGQPPQVVAVTRAACNGAGFGPGLSETVAIPVGLDLAADGSDVVEFAQAIGVLTGLGNRVTVYALAESPGGADLSGGFELALPGVGMPPPVPTPAVIPTAHWLGLSILVFALLLLARRHQALRGVAVVVLLVGAGLVWAATFVADGQIGDWSGETPLGGDPAGDPSNGAEALDLRTVWAKLSGGRLFVRLDVTDIENDVPVVAPVAVTTLEDQPVLVTLSGSDAEGDALAFAIAAAPTRGSLGAITATGPTGATVLYTPSADANGSDSFTVTASDGSGVSAPVAVAVTITPVNDAPVFTAQAGLIYENGGAQTAQVATGIAAGPADEAGQGLQFEIVANDNPALFTAGPTIAADGTLSATPATNQSGVARLTVQLRDTGGVANGGVELSATQTVELTVQTVNKAPSFTAGPAVTVSEDSAAYDQPWASALDDGDGGGQTLQFVVTANSNAALFASGPAIAGDTGRLSFTLAPDAFGDADLTLELRDNGGTANGGVNVSTPATLRISVTPVNDAPTFTLTAPPAVSEDAGAQLVTIASALATGPANESGQALTGFTLTQTAIDGTLGFSVAPSVSATGALSYTAAPDAYGSATFDLTLSDDGGSVDGGLDTSAVQTFTLVVQPVNDAPGFTASNPPSSDEDAGPVTVPGWVTGFDPGPNETGQGVLEYAVTVTANAALFSDAPTVSAAGTLGYTAAPDAFGSATITVAVRDDGGTANSGIDLSPAQTFQITVDGVNDAPVLDLNGAAAGIDFAAAFVEAGGAVAIVDSAALSLSDIDSAQIQSATITLTNLLDAGDEVLGISVGGSGLAASYNAATGVLSLTGAAAPAVYQSVLRTATYNNASTNPDETIRAVTFVVRDAEGEDSAVATAQIGMTAVNTVPSFTAGGDVAVAEDSGAYDAVWASGMDDNDGGTQTLLFVVDAVSDPSLFSAAPTLDAGTGRLQFTPAADAHGSATVQVRLTDSGSSNNSSAAVTFTLTVSPVPDAPVGADDAYSTPEDTALTVPAPGVLGNDSDVDGDSLSAVLVAGPSNGSLSLNADGSFTYTPSPAFNGTDGFVYRASDGALQSPDVTVTITVTPEPDAPMAMDDAFTTDEDLPLVVAAPGVLGNDTDADGDALTAAVVSGPTNGTLTLSADGSFTYSPVAEFSGGDSFTYRANDGGLDSNIATVSITIHPVDDDPVAVADAATVAEDAAATAIDVLANDTDPDGGAKSIASVTQPANGTVTITGGGSGLTYQPDADYCNTPPGTTLDTFTYALTPGGSSASVAVTVTCVDDNPVAVADAATVTEDSGANAINVLANDTDVDAGPISITSVSQPANGSVAITGGGTGLTYQPDADYCNTPPGTAPDTFSYTLTPGGSSATVSVGVTCVDDAPVAVADAATVLEDAAATAIAVLVNDTDIDGGPISITSVTQPGNGTVAITGGGTGLTYQPDADYCNTPPGTALDTFSYTLAPGGASAAVSMTVTCVNDLPVLGTNPVTYATAGNTQLHVAGATRAGLAAVSDATGLLAKAAPTDIDGPAAPSVVAATGSSANGGSFQTFANGAFTYVPPAGFSGTDSFTYAVSDGEGSTNGTVNITVSEVVWYVRDVVDADNPAAGDTGTSANAFETLADVQAASGNNHIIFVFRGNTGTTPLGGGIVLKNGQKLHGEGIGLTHPTHGLLVPAGQRPHITHGSALGNGVTVLADATGDRTGVEIRGLELSGNANAIDVTSQAAAQLAVRISENTISGAGAEGIDVNIGSSSAAQTLAIHDNILRATGTALDINRTAGRLTITAFADNAVEGATGGSGIVVNGGGEVVFDATPGGTFDTVSGGALTIGASGNGVGAAGLSLTNVAGDLAFGAVSVFADNGAGISVTGTAAYTGSTGLRLRNLAAGSGTVQATGGPAVSLTSLTADLRLGTVTSTGSPGSGVNLVGLADGTGTTAQFAAASSSSIASATGTAFNVDGGNATIAYAGTIANTAGRSVAVQNRTADSTTFTGAITDTGQGVLLNANNVAHTTSIRGGLSLSTGVNAAFSATNGGTLEICDETPCNAAATGALVNTLTTTTGVALSVSGTTIGANDLEFRSISAGTAGSGPASGIVLDTTGTLGGLVVKGTGAAGSGGTIRSTGSHGIALTNTTEPSFSSMVIQSTGGSGVNGTGVAGFSFINGSIDASGNAPGESNIAFNGNGSLLGNNLSGVVTITGNTLTNAFDHGIHIEGDAGTILHAVIQNNTITSSTDTATSKGSGIQLVGTGTATTAAGLARATISANTIRNFPSGAGIQVLYGNANSSGPFGFAGEPGNPTNVVSITGNSVRGASAANRFGTHAILFAVNGGSNTQRGAGHFDVSNNGSIAQPVGDSTGITLGVGNNGFADTTATVTGNTIVANNTFGSGGISGGNGVVIGCSALRCENPDLSLATLNNTISQVDGNGILLVGRNTTGVARLGVRNNVVAAPLSSVRPGIRVDAGNAAPGSNDSICMDMRQNTSGGSGGHDGIGLRKQGTATTTHAFGVEGMAATASPGVEAYVGNAGLNPGSANGTVGGINGVLLLSANSGFSNCSSAP